MKTKQKVRTLKIHVTYQDVVNGTPSGPGNLGRTIVLDNLEAGREILSAFIGVTEGFVLPEAADVNASVAVEDHSIVFGNIRSTGIANNQGDVSRFHIFSLSDSKNIELRVEAGSDDVSELTAGTVDVYINYIKH